MFTVKPAHIVLTSLLLAISVLVQYQAAAAPFGQGKFGEDIPFGSATSLIVNLGGDVSFSVAPNGGFFEGNGSHTITVTSTDPTGYKLYVHTLSTSSTDMVDATATQSIPASGNSVDAPLATNTWGYNTTGSTANYLGMLTTPLLLKTANGPYKNGDDTDVYYGLKTDITKGAGIYSVGVVYTVVAINS